MSLKGFPSPVTSALTMPNPQANDGFFHLVFSGRKSLPQCIVLSLVRVREDLRVQDHCMIHENIGGGAQTTDGKT